MAKEGSCKHGKSSSERFSTQIEVAVGSSQPQSDKTQKALHLTFQLLREKIKD
jgi:hypothetical protein